MIVLYCWLLYSVFIDKSKDSWSTWTCFAVISLSHGLCNVHVFVSAVPKADHIFISFCRECRQHMLAVKELNTLCSSCQCPVMAGWGDRLCLYSSFRLTAFWPPHSGLSACLTPQQVLFFSVVWEGSNRLTSEGWLLFFVALRQKALFHFVKKCDDNKSLQ